MQHGSHCADATCDEVGVICIQRKVSAKDVFDCIPRYLVFFLSISFPVLLCVVHYYGQHGDEEEAAHRSALA